MQIFCFDPYQDSYWADIGDADWLAQKDSNNRPFTLTKGVVVVFFSTPAAAFFSAAAALEVTDLYISVHPHSTTTYHIWKKKPPTCPTTGFPLDFGSSDFILQEPKEWNSI